MTAPAGVNASASTARLDQLSAVMPRHMRPAAVGLLILMLLAGMAEMVTVASIVPLLATLTTGAYRDLPLPAPLMSHSPAVAAGLFLAAVLATGLLRLCLNWATQRFALATGHWVASEIHRRMLLQPYSYHVQAHSSAMLAALDKVQDLVWGVCTPVIQGLAAVIMGAFVFAVLLWIDPVAATMAGLLFGGLYAAVTLLVRRPIRRNSVIVGAAYERRVRLVQDSLGSIRDIIINGSQAFHALEFRSVDARFSEARARLGFLATAPRYVVEAIGLAIILLLALFVSQREGGLVASLPLLGALALGAQRLLPLLQQIYQSWSTVSGNSSAIHDLAQLLTLPVAEVERSPRPLPFKSELRLENVRFHYPERSTPALDRVSLTITKGSRVALVGRTGAGKSTLADIVMGLLEPTSGRILVDGTPLGVEMLASWRLNIGHVPQAIFLTDASIEENIAVGVPPAEIDHARLARALEIAQLDDFVAGLSEGVRTKVGERGARLSGGQRQRLALARAIYQDKPFLVLDEATSALDAGTESAVLHALDALRLEGVTVLIIAHRGSAWTGCDQFVHLEAGRVVG